MAVLESIPKDRLNSAGLRARYGLLYTQAQDRCGIRVSSDSLIRHSAGYFSIFGSSSERFYSYYYLGQVRQNSGNREAAMDAYVKASKVRQNRIPASFLCALHSNMGNLYNDNFDSNSAFDEYILSCKYARLSNRDDALFRSLLGVASMKYFQGDYQASEEYLDSVYKYYDQVSVIDRMNYYTARCDLMLRRNESYDRIEHLIDSLQTLYPEDNSVRPWDRWASSYARAGRPDKAMKALENIPEEDYTAFTYATLSQVLDSMDRDSESLEAYKKYVDISDSLDLVLFRQDTRFIGERYSNQISRLRFIAIAISLIILLLVVLGIMILRLERNFKEKLRLSGMYDNLMSEYEDLKEVLSQNSDVNEEAKRLLGDRVRALGAFLTQEKPEYLSRASSTLESLTENRKELIDTIGLLFGIYHPSFVSMLLNYGLSTSEIGFCCLHVLGLRTSEVGDVINRSGYYNISSGIRKKLPVEGMKLVTWLNERFQELG